jgi:predicted glycosyltransferase
MKIWIDFINTPQVSFFEPIIEGLSNQGHTFLLTCRDSSNTVQILKQKGWEFTIIGDKAEKGLINKLLSFPNRIRKLIRFLKNKKIDAAAGQSSFYLPLTAKILGIPSLYTNDNEHALGNIPAFIFATKIILPENFPINSALKQGASKKKTSLYPGIKEGIYLWKKGEEITNHRQHSKPKTIYIRPEPQTAQYYKGKTNFLDNLLLDLKDSYNITLLVREKSQLEHYTAPQFKGISVPEKPLDFTTIAKDCLFFVGAGGSMTREMALIGIPTISVYQGDLLGVDKFMIDNNYLKHVPELSTEILMSEIACSEKTSTGNFLLEKGKDAYQLLIENIIKLTPEGS